MLHPGLSVHSTPGYGHGGCDDRLPACPPASCHACQGRRLPTANSTTCWHRASWARAHWSAECPSTSTCPTGFLRSPRTFSLRRKSRSTTPATGAGAAQVRKAPSSNVCRPLFFFLLNLSDDFVFDKNQMLAQPPTSASVCRRNLSRPTKYSKTAPVHPSTSRRSCVYGLGVLKTAAQYRLLVGRP